eukprot:COSAG01_NODE_14227_length_1480_cov_5.099203_1_plen_58_part_10
MMKLRVRTTEVCAPRRVSVFATTAATVGSFQLAAAQALGVAQIRHVLYNGHVLRPEEK